MPKSRRKLLVNAAQVQTEELINEHEIMQRAYAQANAAYRAGNGTGTGIFWTVRQRMLTASGQGAMDYTDDMLEKLQYIIERSIRDNREKYDFTFSRS